MWITSALFVETLFEWEAVMGESRYLPVPSSLCTAAPKACEAGSQMPRWQQYGDRSNNLEKVHFHESCLSFNLTQPPFLHINILCGRKNTVSSVYKAWFFISIEKNTIDQRASKKKNKVRKKTNASSKVYRNTFNIEPKTVKHIERKAKKQLRKSRETGVRRNSKEFFRYFFLFENNASIVFISPFVLLFW